jgi:RND superfamily putative drug exporter
MPGQGGGRELRVKQHYSHRHAYTSLLCWVVMVAILLPLAVQFASRIQSTLTGMPGTPAETVRINVVKNFSTALAFPTALVWDAKGVPPEQADAAWSGLLDAVRNDPSVKDVTDGNAMIENWPNPSWHAAFVAVDAEGYGDAEKIIPNLRDDVAKLSFPGASRPWVTGGPALFLDLNLASTESLRSGELIAFPVTFIILLWVFRSLIAALLPILVATLGVVCTLGVLCYLASPHPHLRFVPTMGVTFFVPNLVTMIGLGVGIDYCLIYLARYRRERANHLTTREALLVTRQTAGKTVLASALLVMTGFMTLLFIPLEFFTSIAVGGMLVVACVALATLTLLPAMIFLIGSKLEWGSTLLRPLQRLHATPQWCERWGSCVVRFPWRCILVGLAVLGVLTIPFFHLQIASVEAKNIPVQSESRLGYESLAHNLGAGWMMPAIVLVQHPTRDWMDADGLAREKALVEQLSQLPNTEKVLSVTDTTGSRRAQQTRMVMLTSPDDHDPSQSVMLLLSRADPESPVARQWLDQVTALLKQAESDGNHYYVGGLPSVTLTADRVIIGALPIVICATLCSTFILLIIFMRSVLVAFKAIVLNLLCVLAAYGFQVFCFQDGWGSRFFHLYATDGLNTVVLVICFCALFGLSMDYEVFILSAVRESWLDNHNMQLAVQEGLLRVAGIITSAAIIMISVFLSFAFGDVVEIEQLGVGLSFAVLLDATVIRLLMVPSIMALLDRWAFWFPGQKLPLAGRNPRGHHYHGEKLSPPDETKRLTGL